jgi:two-component system, NarL family, sensor histidine kinase UhpB
MTSLPKLLTPGELHLSVRTYVSAIVASVLIPALLIAGWLATVAAAAHRSDLEQAAHGKVREIAAAIDREIISAEDLLMALATSPLLQNKDFENFYGQAVAVARRLDVLIAVRSLAAHQQLLNTGLPWGASLAEGANVPWTEPEQRQLLSGKPAVSDVFFGRLSNQMQIAVTLPVVRDSRVDLVISVGIRLERFADIVKSLDLSADQTAIVIDRTGTIITRTEKNEEFAGTKVVSPVPMPLPEVDHGKNRQGTAVHWYNRRSEVTGWIISISIPDSVLEAPSKFAVASFSVAGGLLLLSAVLLAHSLGGRLSHSVGRRLSVASAALAASEDQRLFAIEAAEVGTWHWDAATGQLTWSDSLRRIIGVAPGTPANRDVLKDCVHPADWPMIRQILGHALDEDGEDRFELDFRVVAPGSPEARWVRAKGRVGRDAFGRPLHVRGVLQDITARKAAEAERDALRRRHIQAQEEERLRLAHELHDQTGQSLTAALLELKGIETHARGIDRSRIRLLRVQLEQMGRTLHHIAWELRPASIDEVGLAGALSNYLSEWSAQFGIETDFHCDDTGIDALPDYSRTSIYRIVQECLTNIAKHAVGATLVSVVMERHDGVLQVMIEDNGSGFDVGAKGLGAKGLGAKAEADDKRRGLGLPGMSERLSLIGGSLEIESSVGGGTTVFVRIPIQLESTAA